LVANKKRSLELQARQPVKKGNRRGLAYAYKVKALRTQEMTIAEQAEQAYERFVSQWRPRGPAAGCASASNRPAQMIRRPDEASSQCLALRYEIARARTNYHAGRKFACPPHPSISDACDAGASADGSQRLVDTLFDPAGELGLFPRPFDQLGGEIAMPRGGHGGRTACAAPVDPADGGALHPTTGTSAG
jgi:hypothetical protein